MRHLRRSCCISGRRMAVPIGISPQAIVSSTARCGTGVNIHAGATIGDDCQIGENTTIYPGAHVLPGCSIGRNVTIGPGAVLYENTVVGDRTIIHGGAVVGAHGFGYTQVDGRHVLTAQLGYVRIGNDVEVGAGTTIDRGTYGATTIGDGTKIDNLVQIAHNCRIGRHNLICCTSRHRWEHHHGRLRGDGRPGGNSRPRAYREPSQTECDGWNHQRRAGRRRDDGHSRHAGARAETQAGRMGETAGNAAGIQSDAAGDCGVGEIDRQCPGQLAAIPKQRDLVGARTVQGIRWGSTAGQVCSESAVADQQWHPK